MKKLTSSTEQYVTDEEPTSEPSADEQHQSKVHSLLQKMTSINIENVGEGLTNFQPLSYPEIDSSIPPPPPLHHAPASANFSANPTALEKTSDYRKIYDTPIQFANKMSYNPDTKQPEDRVMDRLGYIVHLLEEQQNEKTGHVLEEYVLYVLLGTFVIFVVDSFSRKGNLRFPLKPSLTCKYITILSLYDKMIYGGFVEIGSGIEKTKFNNDDVFEREGFKGNPLSDYYVGESAPNSFRRADGVCPFSKSERCKKTDWIVQMSPSLETVNCVRQHLDIIGKNRRTEVRSSSERFEGSERHNTIAYVLKHFFKKHKIVPIS